MKTHYAHDASSLGNLRTLLLLGPPDGHATTSREAIGVTRGGCVWNCQNPGARSRRRVSLGRRRKRGSGTVWDRSGGKWYRTLPSSEGPRLKGLDLLSPWEEIKFTPTLDSSISFLLSGPLTPGRRRTRASREEERGRGVAVLAPRTLTSASGRPPTLYFLGPPRLRDWSSGPRPERARGLVVGFGMKGPPWLPTRRGGHGMPQRSVSVSTSAHMTRACSDVLLQDILGT